MHAVIPKRLVLFSKSPGRALIYVLMVDLEPLSALGPFPGPLGDSVDVKG